MSQERLPLLSECTTVQESRALSAAMRNQQTHKLDLSSLQPSAPCLEEHSTFILLGIVCLTGAVYCLVHAFEE